MKRIFWKHVIPPMALLAGTLPSVAEADYKNCTSIKHTAPSSQNFDIVFSFDKPYVCGQFANGDWWISADASGTVTLVAVQPEAGDGMNGLEINPVYKSRQGFDKRISGYDASLSASLPLRLTGDVSVVKAASVAADQTKCRPCLQFAAVLTVVKAPLRKSENVLRPGYFGTRKTYYPIRRGIESRFSKHSATCCSEAKSGDFEKIAWRYQGVQLDHLEGWTGRNLHPIDNMPDYGASIATDNAASVLRFMLNDFNIGNEAHKSALLNYLQMAVDIQAMAASGVKWPANGGHGNGRKLPLVVAAAVLDNTSFLDAMRTSSFSEDEQVYSSLVSQKALYGRNCTDQQYWSTILFGKGPRDCRDPYGFIDGGSQEIGEAYQKCCTAKPWKYTALAIDLLGLRDSWRNDAFFQYVDRWVEHGVWASPDLCAPFNGNTAEYGISYGPAYGKCIAGIGRYQYKHGANRDLGYYNNGLAEQMWSKFKYSSGSAVQMWNKFKR